MSDWVATRDPAPTIKAASLPDLMPVTPFEGKLQRLTVSLRPEGTAPPAIVAVIASDTTGLDGKFRCLNSRCSIPRLPDDL